MVLLQKPTMDMFCKIKEVCYGQIPRTIPHEYLWSHCSEKIPSNCHSSSPIPSIPIFHHVKLQEHLQFLTSRNSCYTKRIWETLSKFCSPCQSLSNDVKVWQTLLKSTWIGDWDITYMISYVSCRNSF
jgi:hypothetical protein